MNDIKKLLLNQGKWETVEGVPPLMLPKSKGKVLRDYEIYGNSVQDGEPSANNPIDILSVGKKTSNLADFSKILISSATSHVKTTYDSITGTLNLVSKPTEYDYAFIGVEELGLEIGKTYYCGGEIVVSGKKTTNSTRVVFDLGGTNVQTYSFYENSTMLVEKEFTYNGETDARLRLYFNYGSSEPAQVTFRNVYVSEVGYNFEPYGYEIPIVLRGKNLINPNDVADKNAYIVSTSGYEASPSATGGVWRSSGYISIKSNQSYHFNAINNSASMAGIAWYDSNRQYISGENTTIINNNNGVIVAPEKAVYVRVSWNINEGYNPNWQNTVQLEEGADETAFEAYIEPITTTILLNEPLRKVDEYVDYIDFENRKVIRWIKSEFITNVSNVSSVGGTYKMFLSEISEKPLFFSDSQIGYCMSNKFKMGLVRYSNLPYNPNLIQTYITSANANRVAYTFDDTSITTVVKAQEKIGEGFEVNYVMSEPKEEIIELPNIPTPKGDAIVEIETNAKPTNMKMVYKRG
jgi:hypothetical protein